MMIIWKPTDAANPGGVPAFSSPMPYLRTLLSWPANVLTLSRSNTPRLPESRCVSVYEKIGVSSRRPPTLGARNLHI